MTNDLLVSDSPIRISDPSTVAKKIRSFAELEEGWHFGDGVPATEEAIQAGLELLEFSLGRALYKCDAFPGLSGEVILKVYGEKTDLELTARTTNSVDISLEYEIEYVEESDKDVEFAKRKIEEFRDALWKSSESYTLATMSPSENGIQAKLFNGVLMAAEYRCLANNVYKNEAVKPVSTFGNTTPRFLGNLQHTGNSQVSFCHLATA